MKNIDKYKFQVGLIERLYLSERSKRETVRSSLAIPLAALTFASFGFGILASNFVWKGGAVWLDLLSLLCAMLSLGALCFFLWAIRDMQGVEFSSFSLEPDLLEFSRTARSTEEDLREQGVADKELLENATVGALELLAEGYSECYEALEAENAINLELQRVVFSRLLIGLGMLIAAIFLAGALKIV